MTITYRDALGVVTVIGIDQHGISFCDGKAHFEDLLGRQYAVPVSALAEITTA